MLLQRNIPIVVMKPLRGGPMANVNGEITGMLQEANPNGSVASWGMRFAASKPGVLTVLSGMSTPEQVRDNIKTFSPFQPLTGSEEELLRKAAAAYRADGEIPCTDCGACMPCPQNVNIPAMIGAYNQYKKGGFLYDFEYCCRRLPTAQYARNCNECGQCAPLCPQKTVIPAEMTKIAELGKTVPNALNFFDF
jgi:predicted aldo/keto reductase-like oxidoreductase